MKYIIGTINSLISGLGSILEVVFFLLPDSPFQSIDFGPLEPVLGYINYIIPISDILKITTTWLSAIGLYYLVQIALRWLKVIE